MNYAGNNEITKKHFHYHQNNLCIAVLSIIPLCKTVFFNEGYFYSRSFQKYSRTSVENSRTFKGYPTIFQFSKTFQGNDAFSRPLRTMWKIGGYEQSKNMLKTPLLSQTWIPVKMASKTCMSGSILFKFVGTLGCFN